MIKLNLSRAAFIALIFGQVVPMALFAMNSAFEIPDTSVQFLGFNFSPFDICFTLILILLMPSYLRKLGTESGVNKTVLTIILLQGLYQVFVVIPLSLAESSYSLTDIIRLIGPRLYMLLIPFVYWLVLPAYRDIHSSGRVITLSALVLVLAGVFNQASGNVMYTNTGELRLLWGGTAISFAFLLITSFHVFSLRKSNYLFAVVAVVGFVMANHRSAYLSALLLLVLSMFTRSRHILRRRMYTGLVAMSILSLVLIWQVPVLRDNFFSRVATSTDLSDPNAEVRMSRWVLAASYFLDNPVNGSMLRNEYYDSSFLFDMPPHNWVFEVLPTQGLVGLLFYVAIFYLVLGAGMKNKSDPLTWQMTLLIIFYLAFCMANANFLVKWNIHMLAYPCAVILYRNRVLGENHKHDPSTAIA